MVVQDVIKAVTVMFAAYGQSKDTERIKIYCRMLKDVPKDMLISVVQKAMLEYKYLPSVAELAEACRSVGAMHGARSNVRCRRRHGDTAPNSAARLSPRRSDSMDGILCRRVLRTISTRLGRRSDGCMTITPDGTMSARKTQKC